MTLSSLVLCLALAAPPPPVPRAALFATPARGSPQLSPDGAWLGYLGADSKGVAQLFVRPTAGTDAQARQVTQEPSRSVRRWWWAEDSKTLLVARDEQGDENFHLVAFDAAQPGAGRDLTPFAGVRANLLATSPKTPDQVLVTLNQRDPKVFDVHRLTLSTGALVLDTKNPGDVAEWLADPSLFVRAAVGTNARAGQDVRVRDGLKAPWRSLVSAGLEETLELHGFGLDGRSLFLSTSVLGDTTRVVDKHIGTGAERVVAKLDGSDVREVLFHPQKFLVQAVRFEASGKPVWTVVDGVRGDFDLIGVAAPGLLQVLSRDRLDTVWTVQVSRDDAPPTFYLWERQPKRLTPLFSAFPALEGQRFAALEPVAIPARDGLVLPALLAKPAGGPSPLVLLVHGGPWWLDEWGWSAQTQWLVDRGYAVLRVNFRGSTGYGKRFLNAGNKQWGKAMQDDLTDAVAWAIAQGHVKDSQVAIMGQSYGGYAALAGLAFTPERYRCGVDLVGPANLLTLLASLPPYWEAQKRRYFRRIGDPSLDGALLKAASPLFSAAKIQRPLLIGQGLNDHRVKKAESEQMVQALEAAGRAVTSVAYGDEGHGLVRQENRLDFAARTEVFLAACLGGRAEPLPPGGVVEGSSARVSGATAKGTGP